MSRSMPLPSNNRYLIYEDGRVFSLKSERFLSPYIGLNGYMMLSLSNRRGITVHSLVAESFIGLKPKDMIVDHKDGNRLNNHFTNLQYISQRQNTVRSSAKTFTGVTWNNHAKKYSSRIYLNGRRRHLGYYHTPEEAQQAYQNALISLT